jgi:chromosome partitioning protein
MAARVTTFAAQKGGVGKTTILIQSCFLARIKFKAKVLLIDVDPQCNSSDLLLEDGNLVTSQSTVASMLYSKNAVITPTKGKFGIDVIPGDDGINAFPQDLTDGAFKELLSKIDILAIDSANHVIQEVVDNQLIAFAENVNSLRDQYDYIFIDVPPSFLGLPLISAMCATTDVIGLLEPTKFSSDVVGDFIQKVTSIKESYNPTMNFHGFIINKFRGTSKRHKERVELWQNELGDELIANPIKIASWIEDRTEDGEPIFEGFTNTHQKSSSTNLVAAITTIFPEFGEVK